MELAVDVRGLTKRFGDVVALDQMDLQVPAGGIFGFLGPNGAGKTTTLHILLGLVKPDSGSVRVAGMDAVASGHHVRRHCGALLEHNGLYENLRAIENLSFAGRMYGLAKQEAQARAEEALGRMGLRDRADDRTGTWSKGMKQRLAIARALLPRPKVVFLDEPTNGFDPKAAKDLHADLRRLVQDDGLTVFLTTHNLREAEEVCDRVAVLRDGKVAAHDAPHRLSDPTPGLSIEVAATPQKAQKLAARLPGVVTAALDGSTLQLELEDEAVIPDVIAGLVQGGIRILDARRRTPDLERSFIQILEDA